MSTSHSLPADGRRSTAGRPDPTLWSPFFDSSADRNSIERMALAYAVHPEGVGFVRAHLLLWIPEREELEGRLAWSRPSETACLGESVMAARWLGTPGDTDATRLLRSLRFDLDELGDEVRRAWQSGRSAVAKPHGATPWAAAAQVGIVPLRGEKSHGLLVGEWDRAMRDGRPERLEALRSLTSAALGAQGAAERARRTQTHATALASLARTCASPVNLAEAVHELVRLACEGTSSRGAALWGIKPDQDPQALELLACYGPAGVRERRARELQALAVSCATDARLRSVDEGDFVGEPGGRSKRRPSVLIVPVAAFGKTWGALGVYERLPQHPSDGARFEAEDVRYLRGLADQYAAAAAHAAGEEALRRGEQERRELSRRMADQERLAAVGEASARLAREAKNPLASISAFARRVHRDLAADDPHREYLEVVLRESERLEQAFAAQAPPEVVEPARLRMESVNAIVQGVLRQTGELLIRRRVRLLKRLAADVPSLLLDATRMTGAIRNVVEHALERVSAGGRVRIETRRVQRFVVIEIAHDGVADPGRLLEELFVPFHLQGGVETGLAMARQIVLEHGGEVRTRSAGEWSSVFLMSLPIRENGDRRKTAADRRITRAERRRRSPA